jgi:uncharacterized protein YjbJ (UPF0337 family)
MVLLSHHRPRPAEAKGAAQESVGKARRKVGEFVDGVAKAIKK